MPGNEVGDRLHNFFAQENFSQGQHQAQVLDGNWPALNNNNNLLNENPRPIGLLGSNPKSYNLQPPVVDTGRGPGSHMLNGPHGMNFPQSSPRPEVSKSQLQSQQQNFNDYMYGHLYQARQDEGKFLAVNTGSDQCNVASLGSSFYDSQQGVGPEHQTHTPVRSEASESPGSFNLFGSQHQLSSHQSNMLQPPQRQQSGFNDMQQQIMLMRMQELQRQQQLQQLDARQQNTFHQISPFSKVTSSSHPSSLGNGTINSGGVSYPWATETGNTNWLQRHSPGLQGSSNGLISTNRGQGQNLMGLIPQQTDQSLYGVPVSSSRAGVTQYTQTMTDRTYIQPTDSFNNSFQGNQYFALPDQLGSQDRALASKQKFQSENFFGHAPGESLNSTINAENFQQVNSMQRSTSVQEFQLRQELALPSANSLEKTETQAASSHNDVGLDPTEEKILFGSDDNIWAAFGKSTNLSGEACDSVDGTGLLNGGTWSALMQSAVAETSSTDVQPREEWSGLNFHISDGPSGNQNISTCNSGKLPNSFAEGKVPIASSLSSEPIRPSDCTNVNDSYCNLQGSHQSGHKLPYELGHGLQTHSSQRFVQPSEQGSKWMDAGSLQRARAVHGGASYKADPGPSPAVDLQPARSSVANAHVNSEINGLNTAGFTLKPSSMRSAEESSQFLSSSSQINYWKNANPFAKGQGSDGLEESQLRVIRDNQFSNSLQATSDREVKTHEMDNRDKQENSNDSYHSNVSHHTSVGSLRGNALSDVSDSRPGKEKFTNQVGKKISTRKFQYHPMGNLDEDVDPHGVKKPIHKQTVVQQNAQFGQSMFSPQVPKSSIEVGKRQPLDGLRDGKGLAEAHSQSCFASSGSNMAARLSRSIDIHSPNAESPSSPNMLQLLQKVDQSREFGASMQQNASSEMPEAENSDGSMAHLQRSHSSASQGYGLQLGPPSQCMPTKNNLLSSQSSMQTVNSSFVSHSAVEIGENGQAQAAPPSQVQSSPFSRGTIQGELSNNRSGVPGNSKNESTLYKMHGKFSSAFSSGYMSSRSLLENQQMVTGQALINQSNNSFKRAANSAGKDDSHGEASGGLSMEIFSREAMGNNSHANLPTSLDTAKPNSYSNTCEGGVSTPQTSVQHLPVSQPTTVSGISQPKSLSEVLNNISANSQAHLFGVQFHKEFSNQLNIVESSSSALGSQGDQDTTNGRKFSSEIDAISVNSLGNVQGEMKQAKPQSSRNIDPAQELNQSQGEATVKTISDVSPVNSTSMQKDIEAFGQSLKPNNFSHLNYSSINQIRALKNMETEQSNAMLKRIRAPDGSSGGQQMSHASSPSGDSGMLSLPGSDNLERNRTAQQGTIPTQDMPALCQYDSQNSSLANSTSVKLEHNQITPQMAQSWFNRHGTSKNGQALPMHEAQKAVAAQIAEPPFTFPKSSNSLHAINSMQQLMGANTDRSQHSNVGHSSLPTPVHVEHFPSRSLSVNTISQHSIPRPKKRMRVTEDLIPWYKEVSQGLQDLQNISGSTAERAWAKGTNRLTEKVEEDISLTEVPPRLRAKRRLLLTTQLMQQLFHPPPASILSADSKLKFENVVYSASRLALGGACGLVSSFNGKTSMTKADDDKELSFDKHKTSEGNGDKHFSKIVEQFEERKRKLEDDLWELDYSESFLDLTLESQDVEKFSIINRFAKFYNRGQANASSSSDPRILQGQPQRYVTALPMTKTDLPVGVQCLSL
nr:uncharacterized protein LOC109149591 isoform X1 [Ipomoea batatas]